MYLRSEKTLSTHIYTTKQIKGVCVWKGGFLCRLPVLSYNRHGLHGQQRRQLLKQKTQIRCDDKPMQRHKACRNTSDDKYKKLRMRRYLEHSLCAGKVTVKVAALVQLLYKDWNPVPFRPLISLLEKNFWKLKTRHKQPDVADFVLWELNS